MKSLDNAMAALKVIAGSDEPVPVVEISRKLDLPRSSTSRLMASLRDGGIVEQDPRTRRYVAGMLAWRLGIRHRPMGYDSDLISEAMVNVSGTTGFTTWMAVLSGTDIVLLRQHQGRTPVQFSVRLGQTLPAHATAVGKALLSRLPDRTVQTLYSERLSQITSRTIATRSQLLGELQRIRERRVSISDEEAFPGVVSLGGAVYGVTSPCPIGLSISFPASVGAPADVSTLLLNELTRIGRDVGDDFWR